MTSQIHEELIYEGEHTSMVCCPDLPQHHSRCVELSGNDAKANDPHGWYLSSTACYRGYYGTWEVNERRFYLLNLEGRFRLVGKDPLFADWFSGVLRVPRGELLQDIRSRSNSQYEQELLVHIDHGIVTQTSLIDNRGQDGHR